MSTQERLMAEMKTAMKEKDPVRLSTIRLIRSEIKNAEIEKKRSLTEEEVIALIARELKKRRESIALFKQGGRQDLVDKEEREVVILQEYLPEQLTGAEISDLIDSAVRETGAADVKDMGKVMASLRPKITGKADGAAVSRMVKERLQAG